MQRASIDSGVAESPHTLKPGGVNSGSAETTKDLASATCRPWVIPPTEDVAWLRGNSADTVYRKLDTEDPLDDGSREGVNI